MDDNALVQKCIEGDPRAQRMLFEKFAPKMLGVCIRYTKDVEQAEDVLQDGFVKIFTKLDHYNGVGSLDGWVRRIMVNTALDQIRKNLKHQDDVALDQVEYKLEKDGHILEGLMEEDLLKLISEMPIGYKTVFNMFAIEGYSHKEIADEMGISENTSKSQYSRARAFLKAKLEELGIER
ncbi:MAG: RNA polymerase subunit sigma-70 [Bacteroidetes bacterium RIFCSPHIGHO2_02_FULL_44_7]|nr:MAG: RNA polymerase subunit sigma-70 [Bacteroidetes bacterium RIFCSPHIGHO2_02_FULL_44_7]